MKERKQLNAKELAEFLHLPLVKIQRWVHQGQIPCKIKGGSYYFLRDEICRWAEEHGIILHTGNSCSGETSPPASSMWSLADAIRKGGISTGLQGNDIVQVFHNAVSRMPFPEKLHKSILDALLDREEIASTGIGKGIAIPHPRKVLDIGLISPVVPVFFLDQPIDFNSIDGLAVSTLFFLFSPSTSIHLELLSRVSFCLRSPDFKLVLKKKDPALIIQTAGLIEEKLQGK